MIALLLAASLLLAPDEKSELLAAAKKSAEAKNCTHRGELKLVLPEGLDRSGGGDPVKFEGKYDRDAGSWVRTDAFEFVTIGGKTAVRPVSEWRALKDDGSDVQRLFYQGLSGARAPRPPHEDFAAWARAIATVKRGEGDARMYEVEFSTDFSRDLVQTLFPMGKWMDRIPIERPAGSAKVWLDGEGRIAKMEVSAKVQASIQGMLVQLSATRTSTITDYDATKVEIPAEAKKALEVK
jgi:hypothetical protein